MVQSLFAPNTSRSSGFRFCITEPDSITVFDERMTLLPIMECFLIATSLPIVTSSPIILSSIRQLSPTTTFSPHIEPLIVDSLPN